MKVSNLFVLVSIIELADVVQSKKSLANQAIDGILQNHFAKDVSKVDVINYGKSDALIDGLLRNMPATITVKVSKGGKNFPWKNQLNISSIALFDSAQNFNETVKKIKWLSNKRMRYRHLVQVPGLRVADVKEIIQNGSLIDQVSFLMNETEQSIDLVASFWFNPERCRSNHLVTINRFTRKTMRWENSNFYPKKYQNFHGCNLTVAKLYERGLALEVIPELAEIHNFTVKYERIKITDEAKMLQCDVVEKLTSFDGDKKFIQSAAYFIQGATYAVPPGELYTQLEKMFLMFDVEVWIGIGVTLSIGLCAIKVINLMPTKVQNFIFGWKIQTPTLNLVNIFLNGSQHKAPKRNFARFLLMLFIIWSLIIRTCYQSKLFEYLQNDLRRPHLKTIEDLRLKNFTFFGPEKGEYLAEV